LKEEEKVGAHVGFVLSKATSIGIARVLRERAKAGDYAS
jgi:hypothetical protein